MLDVFVYGSGECDQLGIPDFDEGESKIPRKVKFNTEPSNKVYKIACGGMHTLVLTTIGTVYSWGCNDDGALGREGADNEPGLISSINLPMNDICAGDSHSIAYNSDLNLIFRWGAYRDNSGKLGDPMRIPQQMDTLKHFKNQEIKKVVCGANHTLVLSGQSLYAWGNQESGQTGINPKASKKLPPLEPNKFATTNVLDIFTALNHSFLICKKGTGARAKKVLKGWGFNKFGQLGTGDKENQWVPQEINFFNDNNINVINATGGDYHTLFLTDTNEVYVCGKNDEGQCGVPNNEQEAVIVDAGDKVTISESRIEEKKNGDVEVVTTKIEITAVPEDFHAVEILQIDDQHDHEMLPESHEEHEKDDPEASEDDDDVILTPIKLDFFNIAEKKVDNIYSSMNFNYALDRTENQVYSWGLGYSYVLGNKKEENENIPYTIPKQFFKNLSVDQISLGSQHVAVALFDAQANLPRPTLEYNLEEIKSELRKQVEEKKTKTGKRKAVISAEEVKEEEEKAEKEKVKRGRKDKFSVQKDIKQEEKETVKKPKREKQKETKIEKVDEKPKRGRQKETKEKEAPKKSKSKQKSTNKATKKSPEPIEEEEKPKTTTKNQSKTKSKKPKEEEMKPAKKESNRSKSKIKSKEEAESSSTKKTRAQSKSKPKTRSKSKAPTKKK